MARFLASICLTALVCLLPSAISIRNKQANPIKAPPARSEYPYYVSASVPALHGDLYKEVFESILKDAVFFQNNANRTRSPYQFRTPTQLRRQINFRLGEKKVEHKELMDMIRKVIQFSPKASHPYKLDRDSNGIDPQGLIGEWMATALTSAMTTYRDAPVWTLMEFTLFERIRQLIGYEEGKGDGIVVPGIGIGNSYAIQAAMQRKLPNWKKDGATKGGSIAIFVSEHAHFAYEKYCVWEGIGLDGCFRVAVDANGRMDLQDLEAKIARAKRDDREPAMVVGTAGTPVLGAIDPLDQLAEFAEKNGLWFHIDGHLAGSYFLSADLKNKLPALAKCDSFLWMPEKGLSVPTQSGILVAKQDKVFSNTFSLKADVLFRESELYNTTKWDNGDSTMQTTRRPSISSMWFTLKTQSSERISARLNYMNSLKDIALAEVKRRDQAFRPILNEFESAQISFYYIPPSIRNESKAVQEHILAESQFAERLKVGLLQRGIMTISVDAIRSQRNPFFTISLRNTALTEADIKYVLDQIEKYGSRQSVRNSQNGNKANPAIEDDESEDDPSILQSTRVPPAQKAYPDFVNVPIEEQHLKSFRTFFDDLLDESTFYEEKRGVVAPINFKKPEDLLELFDFSLNTTAPATTAKMLSIFRGILKYNIKNGHPYYDDHLANGLDPYSQMADYLTSVLNQAVVTYEDSPAFTLMERELVLASCRLVGYPANEEAGFVVPGGSASNQIAMLLAMQRKEPDFRKIGMPKINKTYVAYVSHQGHYATTKGGMFMGTGFINVREILTDSRGRMDMEQLEKAIKETIDSGKIPFFVTATIGTTSTGAYDPVDKIADLCDKYGMWLHLDGAYGGPMIFSNDPKRIEARLKGMRRSNSYTYNPHKTFSASREVTVFVTRHARLIRDVAPPASSQEFNNQLLYDSQRFDSGIYSLFPDRRANVFKFWLMWKAKGRRGLGEHIDYGLDLTSEFHKYVLTKNETFMMFNPEFTPENAHVNIYYVPTAFRGRQRDEKLREDLRRINQQLDERMVRANALYLFIEGPTQMPRTPIISLHNSALTLDDAKYMLDVIDYYGQDLV